MKSFNKITSLLLLLVLSVGILASCGDPAGPQPQQTDNYVANVEIRFATNDDAMKAAVDAMSSSKSTVYVTKDEMRIETSAEMNEISLTDNYVYFLGILYHENKITVNDQSYAEYKMATVGEADREKLLSDVGAGAGVDVSDFEIQDMTGDEKNAIYTCSNIKDDAKNSLQAIYASNFSALNATVELSGAEYTLETENGRDKSSTLSCHFVIDMDGKSYEITMHITTTYDYEAKFGISAPFNIDDYIEVGYDEIIK